MIDPDAHIFMPVQSGFGAPDLDFIATIAGHALRIETKVNGKKPSPRQERTITELATAGAIVLIIDQSNLTDVAVITWFLVNDAPTIARKTADLSRIEYLTK